jgi:hypothetical protein
MVREALDESPRWGNQSDDHQPDEIHRGDRQQCESEREQQLDDGFSCNHRVYIPESHGT